MPAQPAPTGPTRTQPGGTRTSPAQPHGRRRAGTRAGSLRDGAGWNDAARTDSGRADSRRADSGRADSRRADSRRADTRRADAVRTDIGRNATGPRESRGRRSARRPAGLGRWGALQGGLGVCIIVASAAIGAIATTVTRSTPGFLLGVLVVAGTVAAALAVRPRAGRMILPVPTLAYLVAALISGVVYNRSADSSKTALAIGAAQWIADGFFAMVLGTVLAIAITTARWYLWRRAQPASWDQGWQVPGSDTTWAGPAEGDTGPVRPDTGQRPRPTFHPTTDPRGGARPGGTGPRPGPRSGSGSGPYNFSSGA